MCFNLTVTAAAIKAIVIGLCLTVVSLCSGCFVMISYAATIFRDSGSGKFHNYITVQCARQCLKNLVNETNYSKP